LIAVSGVGTAWANPVTAGSDPQKPKTLIDFTNHDVQDGNRIKLHNESAYLHIDHDPDTGILIKRIQITEDIPALTPVFLNERICLNGAKTGGWSMKLPAGHEWIESAPQPGGFLNAPCLVFEGNLLEPAWTISPDVELSSDRTEMDLSWPNPTGLGTPPENINKHIVSLTVAFKSETTIKAGTIINIEQNPVVPEPATMSLLALGGLALIRRRKA
jgi:hypothetical protein